MRLHKYTNSYGEFRARLTSDKVTSIWDYSDEMRLSMYKSSTDSLCMIGLSLDTRSDEDGLFLTLAFPHVGYVNFGIEHLPERLYTLLGLRKHYDDRDIIQLSIHDEGLWWKLWTDKWSWKSEEPRWRRGVFRPLDILLGKRDRIEMQDEKPVKVKIPMPEGSYQATVTMSLWTYKRPRWPFRFGPETMFHVYRRHDTNIPKGIGKPGKGENSWDCGDDATYGISGPAKTVEEAIGQVVASVLRDRKRYGGSHEFTPSKSEV